MASACSDTRKRPEQPAEWTCPGDVYARTVPVSRLTLLSKPGCHLCDDAREVVSAVLADHPDVNFDEQSILDDQDLFDRYWDEIPVVLLDDKVHTVWKVDAARLRAALAADPPELRKGRRAS